MVTETALSSKGELRPGDIILFAGHRFSARLVNWFQARLAEDGHSEYNHAAVVTSTDGLLFESVRWWPRVISLKKRYRRSKVLIVRWKSMTLERFHRGMAEVGYLEKRLYPIWRQLLHACCLARHIFWVDAVCSELVAKFLYGAGARHKRWAGINVDDLHHEFLRQAEQFEIVFQGRLEDYFKGRPSLPGGAQMDREHLAIMVQERVAKWSDRPVLRYKDSITQEWKEISWGELGEQSRAIALGLMELGVQEGDAVGIFSSNRPEWTLADFGALFARAVSVPIYATNSASQARYIVDDAEIKVIFVGSQEHYDKVKSFTEDYPTPPKIVALDDRVRLQGNDFNFEDFLSLGRRSSANQELEARLNRTSSHDVATLVYTSGTTGNPKGVMLTHANFFYQIKMFNKLVDVGQEDVSLCFLPLSHTYERTWTYFILHQGALNCYCPDFKRVTDYFREVRPTVMVSVPRLYEKIFDEIQARVGRASFLAQKLFHWSLGVGREMSSCLQAQKDPGLFLKLKYSLAQRLAFRQVGEIFGGRVRWVVAGGAPFSRELEEFFHAAGILICQGYGLTETAPVIAANVPGCFKFGTVGRVAPGCEVRFSQEGEILVRGPNVMAGYFKKPQATADAFQNGWFKTGDVGELDKDGFLKITDRIKDLIITSGGKNISPQIIEATLCRNPYIEQAAVIGNQKKFVSALIIPAFKSLEEYARSQGFGFTGREDLIENPQVVEFYDQQVRMQSKDLADCEKIKKFRLLPHEFTLEGGELTPTLKLKRKVIEEKYSDIIESMYQEG